MAAAWTVKNVKPLKEYKLLLTFECGTKKIFDMKPYLKYPMYEPLADISLFNSVCTNGQTAVWNDDINMISILRRKLYTKTEFCMKYKYKTSTFCKVDVL